MKRINPETKLVETDFTGKLVSISDKVLTNVNQTEYRVVTVEFTPPGADMPQPITGFMYEKNYQLGQDRGMAIGDNLLCTATNAEAGVIITVSHLIGGGIRASREMFGFDEPNTVAVEAPAAAV